MPAQQSDRALVHGILVALEKGKIERLARALRRSDGPRGVSFAMELGLGTERQRLFLDGVLAMAAHKGLPRDPVVRTALRMGAYEILFMPGTPVHAAVNETVALLPRMRSFANAMFRAVARWIREAPADPGRPRQSLALPGGRSLELPPEGLPDPVREQGAFLAARWGLPRELVEGWVEVYGDRGAAQAAQASAGVPSVHLRVCSKRGDREALSERLAREGVETVPTEHPLVLTWTGGESPFGTESFTEGWFVAQDPTAVEAAEALGVTSGDLVLDLCAAPGTKATLLAERAGDTGLVLAFDPRPSRRQRIIENAQRLGLENLAVLESLQGLAIPARILVDVPCSNTGVLARRVEARRRLPQDSVPLVARQQGLLLQALSLVQPGGTVVYSTCSIEPRENQEVVASALLRVEGVRLTGDRLTLPDTPHRDGGYFAVLARG